jgi:hypothetical protein
VSKLEPNVEIVTGPVCGAVHEYQTDAPPLLPAWFGSPGSLFAPTFVPVVEPEAPLIVCAAEKLLFAGPAASAVVANRQAPIAASPNRYSSFLPCGLMLSITPVSKELPRIEEAPTGALNPPIGETDPSNG